ncbi:MAG: NUDIX hydrolase [Candidatus Pacearchaeota archaeon]
MEIKDAIKFLESCIKDPKVGLPEELFLFLTRTTPMVNVDLLIKDEDNRTLLSWRNDEYYFGWHIPGGIVRYKEKLIERVEKVAETEIGTNVKFCKKPIAINEIILDQYNRSHFISFLYRCFLSKKFIPKNTNLNKTDNGYLEWHEKCPKNLIKAHEIYRKFI